MRLLLLTLLLSLLTTPAYGALTVDLYPGDEHPEAKELQQYLNTHGYPVTFSGPGSPGEETTKMGPATVAALKQFQGNNNLPQTGIVGERTRAIVNGTKIPSTPITPPTPVVGAFTVDLYPGTEHAEAKLLQQYLNTHGYPVTFSGPGSLGQETTLMGPATVAALKQFQTKNGITPTGVVGPLTRGVLNRTTTTPTPTTPTVTTPSPLSVTVTASPTSIKSKKTTKVTWSSPKATSCVTPWKKTATSGVYTTPKLSKTTTYTIVCKNQTETATGTVKVTVTKSSGGGGGSSGGGGGGGSEPEPDEEEPEPEDTSATALTLTGPTSGIEDVASSVFIVAPNGTLSSSVTVTPASTGGGSFSPSTVTLTAGSPTSTFTYTPSTVGTKSISITNNGGLTNPSARSYVVSAGVATAVTLSGPTSGIVDIISGNFTIGVNGSLSDTITVTPSVSGGGTLTPTSIQLGSSVNSATFTYTPASSGSKSITLSNTGGLTNPTAHVFSVSVPEVAGSWQQLTFPSITRKDVTSNDDSDSVVFNATNAMLVEALTPQSSSQLPYRAFSRATMGEPGIFYYHGSLHSDYPGNEIDQIDIRDLSSTQVGLSINHQPNVPPRGPQSGYGSGSGGYIYRQYDTGLTDPTEWQPYTFHNWTFNTYHPEEGYLLYSGYAVGNGSVLGPDPDGNGSGYVQGSSLYYTGNDPRRQAFIRYYKNNLYELSISQPSTTLPSAPAGVSNYSAYRQSLLAFYCDSYVLQIFEWDGDSWITHDTQNVASFSTGITNNYWPYSKNGNGLLAQFLDTNQVLLYTTNGAQWGSRDTTLDRFNFDHQVYVYDAATETMERIIIPENVTSVLEPYLPNGDGLITFAVDRPSRKVYMGAIDGPRNDNLSEGEILLWSASFDDLETWTPIVHSDSPTVSINFAIDREPMKVYNGYLFFLSKNSLYTKLHRLKLSEGETPPSFTFHRKDYDDQSYQLPAPHGQGVLVAKHVNHAYRTVDGRYYQMAGDVVNSFIQSMYSLEVDESDYSFRTELNETAPPTSGYVRPVSTDDGAWAYTGENNASSTFADKFIWMRGGDGLGYRSNQYMAAAYPNDAAVIADGWTIKKAYVYDPDTKRFTDAGVESWPVDKGTDPIAHPGTWASAAARNGVFDKTTNTFFRFTEDRLVAFNFDTQRIRIWSMSWWERSSTTRVRMDEYIPPASTPMVDDSVYPDLYWWDPDASRYRTYGNFRWEHQALWLDEETGHLYVVSPGTGYLWRFETRGPETVTSEGSLAIPFYPVGKRIPITDRYPGATWSIKMGSYLVPFKGGLLYTTDTPSGNSGTAQYAYWRRLDYAGEWTPITLPVDWAANSFGVKSTGIDNDEILGIGAFPMARDGESEVGAFFLVH
jgi:peptidoglycan hydrolase-like protein with peptidoglycan-binding domain